MSKNKIIIFLVLSVLGIVFVGTSFGYLSTTVGSNETNTLTLSEFKVILKTDINNVNIGNGITYPMSDEEGLNNTPTTFAIENTGEVNANYKVSLVDKDIVSTLRNTDVRYRLKKTVGNGEEITLEPTTLSDTGIIDSGVIEVNQTITYEIVLWVSEESTVNGATWSKAILVEGIQKTSNLDDSGANYPELLDNMIPVYYDKLSSSWKKADNKNANSMYQWFDYDRGMWANAVTVKTSGIQPRSYYVNSVEGTEINMDDITSMWVWIPRYKYIIFNGNNEEISARQIDIIFENGKDNTGTLTCSDSNGTESCSNVINGKSTYTHPAFKFGNEDLTGFWVAKFEMSTDDTTCNSSANEENCNKTGLNVLVKPGQSALRYEDVSTAFANIRRMEVYNNIHGFSQDENATSWLNSGNDLTGEIVNDNNVFDTHLIRNIEWGAVAYLSTSKYGKQGNRNYSEENKEIYINNNNYLTGYTDGTTDASGSISYEYNDLTNGIGASTTGNIYGVYDMNGGSAEYTMGNEISSENFTAGNSGIWSPIDKYYDKYTYSELNANYSIAKFGDAIKEIPSWYDDSRNVTNGTNSWFVRGGNINGGVSSGIFASDATTGAASEGISTRPVLAVSRYMPWLSED